MDQHNVYGTNIDKMYGDTIITYNGIKQDDWLQRYDPLEDNEKKYTDKQRVVKIENTLNSERVCLIKASEGRGKTFLSRIIAHDYFEKGYEVWYGNITKLNASGESLKQWCKKENTNCLVILENLHACKNNDDLECWISSINTMRNPLWYNNGNNKLLFLLNARPTSEDFDTIMSDLGDDVTEELEPDIEYCKGVASLSSRPIDEKALDNFLKNKRFGFDKGNANLRLLRIVIEIWETDTDNSLSSIQDVNEKKIILKFKTKYSLDLLGETEKGYLLFLSSIFQFDIPLSRELLKPEEIDFLIRLCNEKHLVIDKDYKFYLPHSVDALYLSKAIGGRQYEKQTQDKVLDFVDRILNYETPRDFEGDFILLIQGLIQRKEEFRDLIKELTDWPMAERIIKNINPGFVIQAFNPQNGHSSQEILDYYKANLDWLKTSIFELSSGGLDIFCHNFMQNMNHNIFKDFIKNPKDLNEYLRDNDSIFYSTNILKAISDLGEKYKHVLIDYYKQNIDRLKSSFLGLSSTSLYFIYRFFKSDLNIFEDIFKDPKDLENYLRINDKVFLQNTLLEAISGMGVEYKRIIIDYYKQNIDRLKSSFLGLSPTSLYFIYRFFKSDLNIFEDIFKDPKDLENYLRINDKVFHNNAILEAISGMGEEYKHVLFDYYKQNIDRLKPSFLELSPVKLVFVYKAFKKNLKYNIFKDLFGDTKDLENYLRIYDKVFLQHDILEAISGISEKHKHVLIDYYKQNIDRLKPSFLKLSPTSLTFVYKAFRRKPLDYNIVKDIFINPNDFDEYLRNHNHKVLMDYNGIVKAIRDLGEEYRLIHKSFMVQNGYDYFFYSKKRSFCISQYIIDFYWNSKKPYDVFQINENDFMFYEVHWEGMGRFVRIISDNMNENNRKHSINIVKAIIQIVLNSKESLPHASAEALSHFFTNVALIDDGIYQELLAEKLVISNIQNRLQNYECTIANLYLFGHFYSQDWCKTKMNSLIDKADEEQQKVIKEWHDKVLEGIQKEGKPIEQGTLLDYIHNKFFSGQ